MSKSNPTPAPSHNPIIVVLISGRSGSGKSSTANETSHILSALDHAHAHIDGDNLAFTHPPAPNSDLMLTNLRAIWANYFHLMACRTLLISGTGMVLEAARIKAVIQDMCGADAEVEMRSVILVASAEMVRERLGRREIGTELERHLDSSRRMARVLGEVQMEGLVRIAVEGKGVSEVAGEVVRLVLGSRVEE